MVITREIFPLLLQICEIIVGVTQHLGFPLNGLQSKHRETETYGDVRWNIVLLGKQRVCEGLCLTEENIFELEFLAARLVKGNC